MYKQKSFKQGRHGSASTDSGGYRSRGGYGSSSRKPSGSSSRGNYGGNSGYGGHSGYKSNNRRRFRENISQSMYISKGADVESASVYVPQSNFCDFHLHAALVKNISYRDYVNPTKIQDQAIPEILKGKDILGIGRTGSGKTGAFLIPMIDKALKDSRNRVLIITPTRELASQINVEFRKFSKDTRLRAALVIGGESIRNQISILKTRPQFVVATPGRLIDLVEKSHINLSSFTNVVLDEVDQMLDMGFIDDIKLVVSKLAPQRQSLFFSATVSQKEERVANSLLSSPIKIESDKQSPLKTITQDVVKIKAKGQKMQVLHELLLKEEFSKVLVFSGTKRNADNISRELRKKGIRIDSLHGDKSQNKRSRILTMFRQNKIDVLIATDVAARGIDIPNITHVINYDEPANYNDYIHRIGRTGRIGKSGTALTFVVQR
jgi:ATP-dependent RNA helicase RhlE